MSGALLQVRDLSHRYGERVALDKLNLEVRAGEIFGLLGPNGGGKTTLFRVLTTLRRPQTGTIRLEDRDYSEDLELVRRRLGCVFQHPALDKKLTVAENLRHQGHLYGMCGTRLKQRIRELLKKLGLSEREHSLVEDLSGGLQRRVEIAKALLHGPRVLIMDEPSTGLDPGIRMELWDYYNQMRRDEGVTILMTTHLLEEAERCDRVAILDRGRIVAEGAPADLRAQVGGRMLRLRSDQPEALAKKLGEITADAVDVIAGEVVVRVADKGLDWFKEMVAGLDGQITSLHLERPTLADVYRSKVGRAWEGESGASA